MKSGNGLLLASAKASKFGSLLFLLEALLKQNSMPYELSSWRSVRYLCWHYDNINEIKIPFLRIKANTILSSVPVLLIETP